MTVMPKQALPPAPARSSGRPVSVLITGFGPFPGAPFNPTAAVVRRIVARRRPALAEVERSYHVFRTSYAAVDDELPRLLQSRRPDVLLMFGLAARARWLRIETRARNAVSRVVPDAASGFTKAPSIRIGAPATLGGRAPFQKLVRSACASGVPARLSPSAGSYLCNYLYWRGIEAAMQSGTVKIAAFVHVPPVRRGARPRIGRRLPRRRSLTVADLVRAGEAMLLTLTAAARTQAREQAGALAGVSRC
jgi:pyroglutamyl-peptidase